MSFVSVTQDFNTRSSLGRLTLNILFSFAEFERDLIGERTRDKLTAALKGIAANAKVDTVFNTHYHVHQTSNNELFSIAGAQIIAHARTQQWMANEYWIPEELRYEKARPKGASGRFRRRALFRGLVGSRGAPDHTLPPRKFFAMNRVTPLSRMISAFHIPMMCSAAA